MAGRRKKESYTHVVILLLMRCVRPILRELVLNMVKRETPHGQIDEFLAFHKRRIEKELPVIDKYDVYKNILYPSTQGTDTHKWDLTLYVFILSKVFKIDHDLAYYFKQISSIREDFHKAKLPGITRDICKDYRKRLKRARSRLYRQLQDDDLKKMVERRAKTIEARKTNSTEKEEILKQWRDIEVTQLLNSVTKKSGVQKYLTIKILLSKSCREVMQTLVFKCVREKCPAGATEWSLDRFLHRYKNRISRRIETLDKLGRPMDILFPKKQNTHIDEWDISLLCWVLLNVCFLKEDTADSIGEIRTIRNCIAHNNSFSLPNTDYESYMERIKKSLDTCLAFIDDEDLSDLINDQIEEIERTSIDKDETIRRLQITSQNDTSVREQQEKYIEVKQMILNELTTIVKKFKDIEIPECQLELMINNCNEENENNMSKAIVDEVNEALESEQGHSSSRRNENFRRAVKEMLKRTKANGWSFTNATKGSVLINVKCCSFGKLCELYQTYRNDGSDLYVCDVESALHSITGSDVKLNLVMYDMEMDKCVEQIVFALIKRTNAIASMVVDESRHDLSPCTSNAGFAAAVPSDNLDDTLLKIKEALVNQYLVPGQPSYVMADELKQKAIHKTNVIRNTENRQLTSRCGLSSSMDCTVSDGIATPMETELHDSKQYHAVNIKDIKHSFRSEVSATSSWEGVPYSDEHHYLEKALKREMICLYEYEHSTHNIFGTEFYHHLDNMYVVPPLKSLTGGVARIEALKDVFFHESKQLKEIYVTAAAGFGKTAFAKRLVMTWCNAHAQIETGKNMKENDGLESRHAYIKMKQNDLETMKKFDFLFFLSLREAGCAVCEMDSLIYDHVVKRLPMSYLYPKTFITGLLKRENTLVILDGLDEWSFSQNCEELIDIPHRNETCNCTILTTTRPWKLSIVKPVVVVDKTIQLSMLDQKMSERLASNQISLLNSSQRQLKLKSYQEFEAALSIESIRDLRFVPFSLLYLVCLWFDDAPLGKSVFEVLTNTVVFNAGLNERLLVKKGYDNLENPASGRPKLERRICLLEKHPDVCALSKLAFDYFFCCKRTSKLVFDKSEIDDHILDAALKMGIMCSVKEMRVSFKHKILQEYFAALYIHSNTEETVEKLFQACSSVTSILDKLNVIVFLAHLNPSIVNKIWPTLQQTISNSNIVENYRTRVTVNMEDSSNFELLKEIQDMIINAVKETGRPFQLEDIFIDDMSTSVQRSYLMPFMECDGNSIKSLHLNDASEADALSVKKLFSNLRALQKLSIDGAGYLYLVSRLMSLSASTLRCVSLTSTLDLDFTGHFESISSDILHILIDTKQLESLSLRHWQLTDEQLMFLMEVITSKTCMKQLLLDGLDCQTRDGIQLDLFHHQLQDLMICNAPLTRLHADVSSLKYCCIGGLSPDVESSILVMLQTAKQLRTLIFRDIFSSCRTYGGLVDTFAKLFQITNRLKHLTYIVFDIDELNLDQQECEELSIFIGKVQKIRRPVKVVLKIPNCKDRCFCESMNIVSMLHDRVSATCNEDCSLTIYKTKS